MSEGKKAYVVGTLSIDQDGVWHVSYVGPHKVGFRQYFGEGVESERNIRMLLNVVGSRINNAKDLYVEKIKEIQAKSEEETGGTNDERQAQPSEPSESHSV